MTRIQKVHSSCLFRNIVWGFSWVSWAAPDKYGDSAFIMTRLLPSRSFIFIIHPTSRVCTGCPRRKGQYSGRS
jgi:hypothetical protein